MNTMDDDRACDLHSRRAYQAPGLATLGDVCSLTETGSMMSNESPLNLCWLGINMTGNACMG